MVIGLRGVNEYACLGDLVDGGGDFRIFVAVVGEFVVRTE